MSSPSVIANEVDLSLSTATAGVAGAGTVANLVWGEIGTIMQLGSPDDLEFLGGKPNDQNYVDWFTARNLLNYTSNVNVVRVVDEATAKNASVGTANVGTGLLVKNKLHYEVVASSISNTENFVAKYAGELGNSITVQVADSTTFEDWEYAYLFDSAPNTSDGANVFLPIGTEADDEIHVVVIDAKGYFTGVPNSVLESYAYLSKAKDAKDVNGQSSYYVSVLNNKSNYVYALKPITGGDLVDPAETHAEWGTKLNVGKPYASLSKVYVGQLVKGSDGQIPTKSEYVKGFDILDGIDDQDTTVFVAGGAGGDESHAEVVNHMLNLTTNLANRVGFFSPKISDVVGIASKQVVNENIKATWTAITVKNSYGSMDSGVKLQYDKYNDVYRWIPCNADTAGLFLATHNTQGQWMSGAGYNRGKLKDVVQLAYNPDKPSRDILYKMGINCIITEKAEGTLLLGDKTLQAKNSAFTQLGIRFLFIHLRNIISESAKYSLFEMNDQYTRSAFVNRIDPFLRQIKGLRGVDDYFILCDERNNTAKVIQDGYFIGDIFIKPQYSIQWVKLNFSAINRNVSFEEVVANASGV